MKIELLSIEESLLNLVKNLDKENFIYNFLLSYDLPKSSITRLRSGSLNSSKNSDEIYWKNKIFFKKSNELELEEHIQNLKKVDNVKYVILTDYKRLYSVDQTNKKVLDIQIKDVAKHYDFFLSLTNIETVKYQNFESTLDVKATKNLGKLYY